MNTTLQPDVPLVPEHFDLCAQIRQRGGLIKSDKLIRSRCGNDVSAFQGNKGGGLCDETQLDNYTRFSHTVSCPQFKFKTSTELKFN